MDANVSISFNENPRNTSKCPGREALVGLEHALPYAHLGQHVPFAHVCPPDLSNQGSLPQLLYIHGFLANRLRVLSPYIHSPTLSIGDLYMFMHC